MAQGGYKGQPPSMVQEFNDMVSDGISVMVTDKETDQVVGIRISYTQTRSNLGSNTFPTLEQRCRIHPPQYAKTLHLLDTSLCLPDLFKAHPDIDKICYFYALATLPGYRGRGIAKQLVKYAFEVAVLAGCDSAAVTATHPYMDKLFTSLGMTCLKTLSKEELLVGGVDFSKITSISSYFMKF